MTRSDAWLKQAEDDLNWGRESLKAGFYAQTCFVAQQVAEKGLKAYVYSTGVDLVKSHSLVQILKGIGLNGKLEALGRKLDLFYLPTRDPDALPDGGVPSDYFGLDQGRDALAMAEAFLEEIRSLLQRAEKRSP